MLPLSLAFAVPAVAPMTEIPVYSRIDPSDLTLVDVPDALDHPSLVRDMEAVAGLIALEPLLPGEPLREERLGTGARRTLLGPGEDLVLVRLGRPEHWAPGRVDLVALTDGGACLLAQDVRAHGTPEPGLLSLAAPALQAHQLRWALSQMSVRPVGRNPIDRGQVPELACAGGLPSQPIELTSGLGTLLRLGEPLGDLMVSDPEVVAADAVTTTDLWLHGGPPGRTAASLHLASGGPPVLLDLTVAENPPPATREPMGGLWVAPGQQVVDARVWPPDAATLEVKQGRALLRPTRTGPLQVFTRTGEGALDLHELSVDASWPAPARGEAVLPLKKPGKRRKVSMPAPVTGAFSGDPAVATVEIKGKRARVTAQSPGTTRVVLFDTTGASSSVRVVVL